MVILPTAQEPFLCEYIKFTQQKTRRDPNAFAGDQPSRGLVSAKPGLAFN
jgi:hypothetical protein